MGLAQELRALKSDFLDFVPALPLTSWVTLGNLLNLPVPPFSHLENKDKNGISLTGLLQQLNELRDIKCSE